MKETSKSLKTEMMDVKRKYNESSMSGSFIVLKDLEKGV